MSETARSPVRGSRLEFRDAAAHPRCLRGDRAQRAWPRRLSEPDRGHHRRADARRLFLDRHAAVLQALVVRQAVSPIRRPSTARGCMGLAYEIVINSSPCISYLMEENTATMQTLVIAHAAFGHNHFFKNNYLFKQWTDAYGILDYLELRQGLCRAMRGASRPGRGRAHARCRARADVAWHPPLSRQEERSICAQEEKRERRAA